MMHQFDMEVHAAHTRGEFQRAVARVRAADLAAETRGERRGFWLSAAGNAASSLGARVGRAPRPSLLDWGWVTSLRRRPA